MPHRFKTVLLLGAPGVGKGTQGKILGSIPGYFHCACGDVFRNLDVHSELGKIFYEYSSRGELVPDDVTVRMWSQAIQSRVATHEFKPNSDLLVLDGIPRTVEQAHMLEELVDIYAVIHLVCKDEEAMIDRLRRRAVKENRFDDADENVIRNRWKVYEAETKPVLAHYPDNLIHLVDAVQSPARVLHDVLEVVSEIQESHFTKYIG
ncbi:MAG: nucleoside monophosphate kinase [Phycisphaeraceae bacterium]|nr:nucleoside monophosphate kinase [Phycisphaeraceae bacterium]